MFVFTTLEPFLKPILQTATTSLQSVSGEVINNHDQYEVFDDPRAVSCCLGSVFTLTRAERSYAFVLEQGSFRECLACWIIKAETS